MGRRWFCFDVFWSMAGALCGAASCGVFRVAAFGAMIFGVVILSVTSGITLFSSGVCFADDGGGFHFLPLTGRVFADAYLPTNDGTPDKPFQQLSLSAWLETAPRFAEDTFLKG